jgi:subtilisin family serine protease
MNALLAAAALALAPAPPMDLPASTSRASPAAGSWIVGAARPAPALAGRFGARSLGHGAYVVPRTAARTFAAALRRRGLLFYAERDAARTRRSALESAPDEWARGAVVPSTLAPPSPTAAPIAVIDDFVDASLPDLAGHVSYLNATPSSVVEGPHGTEVASAASAAADGAGILGLLPGNTILSGGVPTEFSCADTTPLIYAAIEARAKVINMSYGSHQRCFAEYVALQYALSRGILAVAASGNELTEGNAVSYPAGLPHVLSVAALDPDLSPSYFSTANAAVDVAAPGRDVPVDVPLAFDSDGLADGYTLASGTSFAAPIAAGAAAWLLSARPALSGAQAGDLLRRTAIDVAANGYDVNTGFGLINVERALAAKTPPRDPLEPNDGLEWVDGRAFDKPDPFVWRGGASFSFVATLDEIEDPVDVYRFRVAPRSRVRVTVNPSSGNPALLVLRAGATSFSQSDQVLGSSSRPGGTTESVRLVNTARAARWAFAVVLNDSSARALDVRYRLAFKRVG